MILETMKKIIRSCALNLATDGSKDNLIHCFKEDEPCKAIKEILKKQLSILTKKNVNPFDIDENDVVVATRKFMIVVISFLSLCGWRYWHWHMLLFVILSSESSWSFLCFNLLVCTQFNKRPCWINYPCRLSA